MSTKRNSERSHSPARKTFRGSDESGPSRLPRHNRNGPARSEGSENSSQGDGKGQYKHENGSNAGNGAARAAIQPLKQEETDAHRLRQRQKQIDMGKNTLGYTNYLTEVPKEKRTRENVATPDIHSKCSKRAFDGRVKVWRRALHKYDPDGGEDSLLFYVENEMAGDEAVEATDDKPSTKSLGGSGEWYDDLEEAERT